MGAGPSGDQGENGQIWRRADGVGIIIIIHIIVILLILILCIIFIIFNE